MKHLKQTLAMLLAMALMLAAFAGCGSTAASSAAQPASEAPAENTEQAAPEAPAAPAADSAAEPASTPEDAAPAEEDIPDLQLPLTDGATLSYWQTKPGGAVANMAPNGYLTTPISRKPPGSPRNAGLYPVRLHGCQRAVQPDDRLSGLSRYLRQL